MRNQFLQRTAKDLLYRILAIVFFNSFGMFTPLSSSAESFALMTRGNIVFNGNNVWVDSFDSSDPLYSSNGHYDLSKAKDGGNVLTTSTNIPTVSVGNALIYGHVATGLGGTVSVGSSGGIGSHDWLATQNGVQPGWVTDDANLTFPDITLPYNSGSAPAPGDVVTITTTADSSVVTASDYPDPAPLGGCSRIRPGCSFLGFRIPFLMDL